MSGLFARVFGSGRKPAATWIDTAECQRRLTDANRILLIDVRGPDEFTAPPGHLPGAANIPLGDLPRHVPEIVSDGRPVVLVCKTDRRSAAAAEALLAAGVRDVAILRGGTDGWHHAGLPLD